VIGTSFATTVARRRNSQSAALLGITIWFACWEPRQPQDFVRAKVDKQRVPPHLARPDDQQEFTELTTDADAVKGDVHIPVQGLSKYNSIEIETDVVAQVASSVTGDNVDSDNKIRHGTYVKESPGMEDTAWHTLVDDLGAGDYITLGKHSLLYRISRDQATYLYRDLGTGAIPGDFSVTMTIRPDDADTNNTRMFGFALSDTLGDLEAIDVASGSFEALFVESDGVGGNFTLGIRLCESGSAANTLIATTQTEGTQVWVTYTRVGSTLTLNMYSDAGRQTLIDSATVDYAGSVLSHRYFYYISSYNTSVDRTMWGMVGEHKLSGMSIEIGEELPDAVTSGNVVQLLHDNRFLGTNEVTINDL
jgi:hypothetical protein